MSTVGSKEPEPATSNTTLVPTELQRKAACRPASLQLTMAPRVCAWALHLPFTLVFAQVAQGLLSLAESFGKGLAFKSIDMLSTGFPKGCSWP